MTIRIAALGLLLLPGACDTPPQGPRVLVVPPKDKDLAAFQQDDLICRQHAVAHSGYTPAAPPAAPAASAAQPPAGSGEDDTPTEPPADSAAYAQCMAARGNIVSLQPYPPAPPPFGFEYPYPYAFGYPYAGDYPFFFLYGGGFHGGFGWSHDGFDHGVWHSRGFAGRRGLTGRGFAGAGRGGGSHH